MSDTDTNPTTLDFSIPTALPESLPVLALRRGAILPGAVMPLAVGRPFSVAAVEAVGSDDLLLVGVQNASVEEPGPGDLLQTAVLARVVDRREHKGRPPVVVVQGLARVRFSTFTGLRPHLVATFELADDAWPDDARGEALARTFREALLAHADRLGGTGRVRGLLGAPVPQHTRVDLVASQLPVPADFRRELLETMDATLRAEKVIQQLRHLDEIAETKKAIEERMESDAKGFQKEALLRRQLKAIKDELGEAEGDEISLLKARLAELDLPDEVQSAVTRELKRLDRINPQSPERNVAMDWLEWIAEMPWTVTTGADQAQSDGGGASWLGELETALETSHFGLDDVKRQVVEHLSVRALAGSGRADVLLLVGPPGVGKTSIGQAIADATGRKLVRVALGGVRDEASLRGHRRTYVGAKPGRLVEGLRRAGAADPVVLLDEVDKLGKGWQGDPSAALLEILDPEQNHSFTDHYLDVPFDLSRVLFIATANDLSKVPGPLRDRMEIIDIPGYTREEKVQITKGHLLERLAKNAGVSLDDVAITDEALEATIAGWTREAGVRGLQRTLGRIFRAAAVKKAKGELTEPLAVDVDELSTWLGRRKFKDQAHEAPERPGIATGLAWTPVGGSVLYVEAATLPGKGQLLLTGQLGDVMKESARAAMTYVLSHAEELGIDPDDVLGKDVHLHVPAGGVPKDGPSAGVTMFTALTSLLTGRSVKPALAMTGEATLRGRVLPVGGIKAKVLGAHRHGVRTVILPRRNEADLDDIPQQARDEMTIHLVDDMREVLALALEPAREVLPEAVSSESGLDEAVA